MASLLDLGADLPAVRQAVESVGCTLDVSRQERGHIAATRANVVSDRRFHSLEEAKTILQGSSLSEKARQDALKALDILAAAEGRVHGAAKEQVHFHEVGALDALADIAGCSAARHSLSVQRIVCRTVSVGGGYVQTAHGLLPVPGPAALEIMRAHKIPWQGGPVEQELLTPTGGALLAALVDGFVPIFPSIRAERVGYGAGSRELEVPNVLRAVLADLLPEDPLASASPLFAAIASAPPDGAPVSHPAVAGSRHHHGDRVVQLESNVDDVTGEVLGYLLERLMLAGALDASVLPALMKKGRGGYVIRVIARQEQAEALTDILMEETGSLGVRIFPSIHRLIAERQEISLQVEIDGRTFDARAKASRRGERLISLKPEYEDCKRIAEQTGLPLRSVMKKVEEAAGRGAEI